MSEVAEIESKAAKTDTWGQGIRKDVILALKPMEWWEGLWARREIPAFAICLFIVFLPIPIRV